MILYRIVTTRLGGLGVWLSTITGLDWTGLDWTGLDWTTGLSLKLRACQYINTYNVFVQLINGAYSYAACPGIILCCH